MHGKNNYSLQHAEASVNISVFARCCLKKKKCTITANTVVVDTKGKNIVETVVWLPRLQFACVLVLKGLKNCEQTANITLLGVHKNKKNICVVKRLQAAACKEYYIVLRAWAKNVIKTWCSSRVRRLHYQQHSRYQHTSTHLLYPLMALPVCAARQNANKETLHAGTRDTSTS